MAQLFYALSPKHPIFLSVSPKDPLFFDRARHRKTLMFEVRDDRARTSLSCALPLPRPRKYATDRYTDQWYSLLARA